MPEGIPKCYNITSKKIDQSPSKPILLQGDLFGCGGWSLEPHICRKCFGRLLSRSTDSGQREYLCSNCGDLASGASPAVSCACGIRMRKPVEGKRMGNATIDAGIRCHLNPTRNAEFPAEYVASYKGKNIKI